jgi:hypothetical protein
LAWESPQALATMLPAWAEAVFRHGLLLRDNQRPRAALHRLNCSLILDHCLI